MQLHLILNNGFRAIPSAYPARVVVSILLIVHLCFSPRDACGQETIDRKRILEEFRILKTTLEELHPDLYRYTSREEFEYKADSISKLLQADLNPIDLYLTISPLVTQIKNGHTAIRLPQRLCDTLSVFPLRLIAFEEKVYISKDLGNDDKNIVGRRVGTINDVPVEEIVRKSLKYASVDGFNNSARFKAIVEDDFALYYGLIYGGSKKFKIRFADNAMPLEAELRGIAYQEFLTNYDKNEEFPWSLTRLDSSGTALLTIRSFNNIAYMAGKKMYFDKTIEGFFRAVKNWHIEHLILDIRFNGGGELKNSIFLYSFLANTSFQFTKQIEMASIAPPSYAHLTNYKKALKYGPINRKHVFKKSEKVFEISKHFSQDFQDLQETHFAGKLIVLVNGNTASSAGALASCIKNDKRGVIVGEENRDNYTGFAAGVPVVLTLPYSGITVSIPIRKFTYATGPDTGRGVMPDYVFASTAEDFFENRTSVFDIAMELLKK